MSYIGNRTNKKPISTTDLGGDVTTFAKSLLNDANISTGQSTLGISAEVKPMLNATTASAVKTAIGIASSGANSDITSLASPNLINTTATTRVQVNNTTAIATTEYVTKKVMATAGGLVDLGMTSMSGLTSKSYTIPSTARKIHVLFYNVSLSGTDRVIVQIGNGTAETTGYSSAGNNQTGTVTGITTGFLTVSTTAANSRSGVLSLVCLDPSNNIWVEHGITVNSSETFTCSGSKTLAGTLTTLKILATGSNTFDSGYVNVLYE